jgi:peroxiredoxin
MVKARKQRELELQQEAVARRRRTLVIWLATGVVCVVLAVVVGVLAGRSDSAPVPSAADPSSANANAPASLVKAADAVGFEPHSEPGTGLIEDDPADKAPTPNPDLLQPGTTAPPFTLKTPEGESVSLADYRGKAVLLELFATWCPHCQAEAPHLERLAQGLDPAKQAILSIDGSSGDAASVFAFHRYFGLSYPALLDPSGQPGSFSEPGPPGPVATSYKLENFPTFYVIGPDGAITWSSDGEQPDAMLRQQLDRAAGS